MPRQLASDSHLPTKASLMGGLGVVKDGHEQLLMSRMVNGDAPDGSRRQQ